jgi:hypothetical protein
MSVAYRRPPELLLLHCSSVAQMIEFAAYLVAMNLRWAHRIARPRVSRSLASRVEFVA